MKTKYITQSFLLFFTLFTSTAFSQIEGVNFLLSSTETSSVFEVSFQVTSGSTQSIGDRLANNAQVALLIPTAADFSIVETLNPRNDQDYDNGSPIPWDITSAENTDVVDGYKLYIINPNFDALSNTAWYDDMTPGTTVPLFRFMATGTDFCDTPYLIAENSDVEVENGNGMTIGGFSQLYISNDYESLFLLNAPAMCIDELYQIEFICAGGTWTSNNPNNATITAEGVITAINSGKVKFTYTHTDGRSYTSEEYSILSSNSSVADVELCVGEETFVISIYNADFISSNPSVATVDGKKITAVSSGEVYFYYDNPFFICREETDVITVFPKPTIVTSPPDSLCAGSTFTLQADQQGVWLSDNSSVLSINNLGVITPVSEGISRFKMSSITTLCESDWTEDVISVVPRFEIFGGDKVCVGSTFSYDIDASSQLIVDEDFLEVDYDNETLTAISEGMTDIIAYNATCNDSIVQSIIVGAEITSNIGDATLCISDNLQLNPIEGTWTSSPEGIVTISEAGKLSPLAAGQTVLSFSSSIDDCTYISDDINITIVDTEVDAGTYGTNCNDGTLIQLLGIPAGGFFSGFGVSNGMFDTSQPPGSYVVKYTFTDLSGCTSIAETIIFLEDCSEECEFAPSFNNWPYMSFGDYSFTTCSVTDYTFLRSKARDYDDLIIFDKSCEQLSYIYYNSSGYLEGKVLESIDVNPIAEYKLFSMDLKSEFYDNPVLISKEGDGTSKITIYELDFLSSSNLASLLIGSDILLDKVQIIDFDNDGMDDIVFQSSDGTMNILYFDQDNNENLVTYQLGSTCNYFITESNNSSSHDILLSDGSMLVNNSNGEFEQSVFESPLSCDEEYTFDLENKMLYGTSKVYQLLDDSEYRLIECDSPFLSEGAPFLLPIERSGQQSLIAPSVNGFNYHPRTSQCSNQLQSLGFAIEVKASKQAAFHMEGVKYHNFIDFSDDGTIYAWINPNNLNTVSGTVFSDINNNGIRDSGEPPLKNVVVQNRYSSLDASVLTDEEGKYNIHVLRGDTRFKITPQEGQWTTEFQERTVDYIGGCKEGVNYAFVPDPSVESEIYLSYTNSITRCSNTTRFTFVIENTGGQPLLDSKLDFTFNDEITFVSSDLPVSIGDTLSVELPSITPFEPLKFDIYLLMPNIIDENFGDELKFSSEILDSNNELLDLYATSSTLRCSYDPNDKIQHPNRGGDFPTLLEEELEYTIRFQNNGNDTAFLVRIIDTLDQFIDGNTVRVIDASHKVETHIMNTNNTIVFNFDDINLVDSMTNYPGSQGFVSFRCKQKGTSPGDVIYNKAQIYFDSNPPIVTNSTINTIVSELCPVLVSSIDTTICEGQSIFGFSESGEYEINNLLDDGCDSIVNLSLEVIEPMLIEDLISLCEGDTIIDQLSGQVIIDDIILYDTLIEFDGCISSITETTYDFSESIITFIDTIICEGDDFLGYQLAGNYEVTYVTEGCDSIVNLNLSVIPTLQSETNFSFCEGDFVTHPGTGETISSTTTIVDTIYGDFGCITSTDITNYEMIAVQFLAVDTIICEGENYQGYTESGNYIVESIDSLTGCFILTNITLDVLPASHSLCTVSTDNTLEFSLQIYPNPVGEKLNIESDVAIQEVEILNMSGQRVYSSRKINSLLTSIDVVDLHQGVYLIKLSINDGTYYRKVIIW